MAGIVGFVSRESCASRLQESLECLCHGSEFAYESFVDQSRLGLGVCHRRSGPARHAWRPEVSLGAVLYGWAVVREGATEVVDPAWIIDAYRERGPAGLTPMDGDFVAAVLDLNRRRLILINDRTATIPIHVLTEPGLFAFAPEAKAIHALLGRRAALDREGLLEFLTFGHALGSRTLLAGCRLLEPASMVEVELDSGRASIRPYWQLSFRSRRGWSEAEAADALHSTVLGCLNEVLLDSPAHVQLLLTGGYDSRTVLAGLSALGRPPDLAVTWGVDGLIPDSDPAVARKLAADHETAFRFLPYGAETFLQRAGSWARISELGSDNLGNFAGGADLMAENGLDSPVVLIGDQLLGTGGEPVSRLDAVEAASGVPRGGLAPGLAKLTRPGLDGDIGVGVKAALKGLADRSPSDRPKDLQDFLGFHIRLARWLDAPCYFREPMVSVRRPMLLSPMIDLFEELPPRLRVDKRVLIAMIRQNMPHLAEVGRATANSLIDWDRAFTAGGVAAGLFRELLEDHLSAGAILGDVLDPQRLETEMDIYCSKPATPMRRSGSVEGLVPAVRRSLSRVPGLGRGLRLTERAGRWVLRRPVGAPTSRVLQRLALVSLLQRELAEGLCRPYPAGGTGAERVSSPLWRLDEGA